MGEVMGLEDQRSQSRGHVSGWGVLTRRSKLGLRGLALNPSRPPPTALDKYYVEVLTKAGVILNNPPALMKKEDRRASSLTAVEEEKTIDESLTRALKKRRLVMSL
ncbi:hypothetical protein HAX54_030621 [Datura stramonium]|uniref:Uncharacterized protein n=1 Tax=Datura stramonium TaxID=4076 RepID=A0ABS8SBF9_DATST|nr:hypothetical protein [Datura stramonium]